MPPVSEELLARDSAEEARERAERPRRRPLRLLLIRHGESAMNVRPDLIGGRSNSAPLTARGAEQAVALGRRLQAAGVRLDRVFSSPAVRARATADLALVQMGLDPPALVVEVPDVLEICQGEWTGRPREEVYDAGFLARVESERLFLRPPGVSEADALPGGAPPPGESQWDVECRFAAFVDQLLAPPEGPAAAEVPAETVAIFTHGVAIRCFLRRVLGASTTAAMHCHTANTSIAELLYRTSGHNLDGWQVVRVNDAAHLEQLSAREDPRT